jgi:preprotein translocase subunit SecF
VLAAFLTAAGCSINDDRSSTASRPEGQEDAARRAIFWHQQTLSRTIFTVLTVMMTSAAMFFFGGEVIHDFALAMLIGVGFGTYSSVFVASALSLDIDNARQKRDDAKAETARAAAAAAKVAAKTVKKRAS